MPTVVILYDSRTGHTHAAATAIAEGAALVPNVTAWLMNAEELDLQVLADADALAIGSPNYYTYPSGRIKTFFDLAYGQPAFKAKPFAAFSTHGGGGSITPTIEKLATTLGMTRTTEGLDFLNAPAGDQLKSCRHLGTILARAAANNP